VLRRVVDELGEIPSVLAYERLAAGRSDLPSSATLRNRLGRWSFIAARLAAQRELAQQAQLRARTASAALARTYALAGAGNRRRALRDHTPDPR